MMGNVVGYGGRFMLWFFFFKLIMIIMNIFRSRVCIKRFELKVKFNSILDLKFILVIILNINIINKILMFIGFFIMIY